jgi:hypothetical protein
VLQGFAEIADQTAAPATALARIILDCLDPHLRATATLPDRTPVDRSALGPELPPEPLCRLQDIARHANRPVLLAPHLLQQRAGRKGDVQLAAVQCGIGCTPEQHTAGELPIPSGSAGLLIVGLGSGRCGPVNHQPNVGLVDPHPKGTGGDYHVHPVAQKIVERGGAAEFGETCVIGRGSMTGLTERARYRFSGAPRGCIHDGHDVITAHEVEERVEALRLAPDLDRAEP